MMKMVIAVLPALWLAVSALAETSARSACSDEKFLPEFSIEGCNELLKQNPNDPTIWFNRGRSWHKLGDYDRAITDYTEAIKLNPAYKNAYINRGIAWYRNRAYDRAISDLDEAIRLNPKNPKADELAYRWRGTSWFDKANYERAISDFTEQIKINPKNWQAYGYRGMAWDKLGYYDRAIADYDEEIRLNPTDSLMHSIRGTARKNTGDYSRAAFDFSEAIRINPKNILAYIYLGDLWVDKGDLDRAIGHYNEAIALDPTSATAYNNRANAWSHKGELDSAIADYSQAIKLDPKEAKLFFNRGLVWERKKDVQQALADFKRSLELDPSFVASKKAALRVATAISALTAAEIKAAREEGRREFEARSKLDAQQNGAVTIPTGRRLALVIGNNVYQRVSQLEKAVGDADAVSEALRSIGFTVTEGRNLTFEQTAKLIADFEESIAKPDIVFFHFSGHGVQIKGDNILLPIDVPQPKDGQQSLIEKFGLSAEATIQSFNEKGASLVVAVFDACRDNPFASSGTRGIGTSQGLAPIMPIEGSFVFYSAGVNQTALDKLGDSDPSPTSVFTRVFLPLLREPNQTLIEIAKRAQVSVRDLAAQVGHQQTPAYYDQVIGSVGLVGK
jgi:tetratricopeptide (TPR) repeat protein